MPSWTTRRSPSTWKHFALYTPGEDEEFGQDHFMTSEMESYAAMHASFGIPETHIDLSGQGLQDINQFHFDLNAHDLHGDRGNSGLHQTSAGNFFEADHTQSQPEDVGRVQREFHARSQAELHQDVEDYLPRQPLTTFDASTSWMLQEQMHDQAG